MEFSGIFLIVEILAYSFILVIGMASIWVICAYFLDRFQTQSTLRRNFPVLARFRYSFEHIGQFFRQYFFAQDREEMPFNRAERSWCYRAAKDVDSTVAFGSSRNLRHSGTVYFVNCPFPTLSEDSIPPAEVTIGPYSRQPYATNSLINISGMSYGAISIPAIRALSRGAKMAGIWMNTGEGGLSPYHLESGCDIVFQIGTAKFGVRKLEGGFDDEKLKQVADHEQVRMFELKLSQGAKPGKGGILPGVKVTREIAEIRNIKVGESAISPNRHPEIESTEDLLDMIHKVREVTGKPVGFKMVVGQEKFFDVLCEHIGKRGIESAPATHIAHIDAQPHIAHSTIVQDLFHHHLGTVDGDGKADALRFGHNGSVDPHQFAQDVQQWPTAVTRVDGGIRLDEVGIDPVATAHFPARSRHHPGGDGIGQP
jgi:hypothetical protein